MKRTLIIGLLSLGLIGLASCKKYDNGGSIKDAETNIQETWKIDQYLYDGTDATSQLLISNFLETFAGNGNYSRSYTDENGDPVDEQGSWSMDEDKMTYSITGTGSYELTNETSTVSTSEYNILKLTKDELWYQFHNGGSSHEFHMVPN